MFRRREGSGTRAKCRHLRRAAVRPETSRRSRPNATRIPARVGRMADYRRAGWDTARDCLRGRVVRERVAETTPSATSRSRFRSLTRDVVPTSLSASEGQRATSGSQPSLPRMTPLLSPVVRTIGASHARHRSDCGTRLSAQRASTEVPINRWQALGWLLRRVSSPPASLGAPRSDYR